MNKRFVIFFLILVLLLAMSGCSAVSALQKLDAAEDRVEAKLDAAEDRVEAKLDVAEDRLEEKIRQTLPPTAETAPQILTAEEVQKIALDYLGFTADQVTRLHTEFEIDDGIPQYDVGFHSGDWEYEFEIHGETGQILSYDKDHKYD